MGSALILSDKAPLLPEKQRKTSLLTPSNTTSIPEQEQHTTQNIDSTIDQEQFNESDSDDYYFDDEDEEETQWSLERRTATLRDTGIAIEKLRAACEGLKESVSTQVDALLKDLPDAQDPEFERKYKTVRQRLQQIFPKKWNKSKQQTKKKK